MASEHGTNGVTTRVLAVIVAMLIGIIGAMAGHITTRAEIIEQINSVERLMDSRYVPRTELESRLSSIQSTLIRIERRMDQAEQRRRDGQ